MLAVLPLLPLLVWSLDTFNKTYKRKPNKRQTVRGVEEVMAQINSVNVFCMADADANASYSTHTRPIDAHMFWPAAPRGLEATPSVRRIKVERDEGNAKDRRDGGREGES